MRNHERKIQKARQAKRRDTERYQGAAKKASIEGKLEWERSLACMRITTNMIEEWSRR